MKGVALGWSRELDPGNSSYVAASDKGHIIEVHSDNRARLIYRIGVRDEATVRWGPLSEYDLGITPSCATNSSGIVVEVHHTEATDSDTLWCHLGMIEDRFVDGWRRGNAVQYDEGIEPSVAMNDRGQIVAVHHTNGSGDHLYYRVGQIGAKGIIWSRPRPPFGHGRRSRVALSNDGVVVELHASEGSDALFSSVGRIVGDDIIWGPATPTGEDGTEPSVAFAGDLVLEVHRSQNNYSLWSRAGIVKGDAIAWFAQSDKYEDVGLAPCIAATPSWAIQTHLGMGDLGGPGGDTYVPGPIFFSTSLVVDRASWMHDRIDSLGTKSLREISIPGAHDAGMYGSGWPESYGETQDLDIYGQLMQGARYFDLRVLYDDIVYIHHDSVSGPPLQSVLDSVSRFLTVYRELIVLKISNFEDFTPSSYDELLAQIQSTLDQWLYRGPLSGRRLADVPLREFIPTRGCVLVVVDGNYPVARPSEGIWVYRDRASDDVASGDLRVMDQYANTTSYDDMKSDQIGKYIAYDGLCAPTIPCDLFLLSWTLTPDISNTIGNWGPDVYDLARTANPPLGSVAEEIQLPNPHGMRVNVVYVDYFEYAHATDVCILLNMRTDTLGTTFIHERSHPRFTLFVDPTQDDHGMAFLRDVLDGGAAGFEVPVRFRASDVTAVWAHEPDQVSGGVRLADILRAVASWTERPTVLAQGFQFFLVPDLKEASWELGSAVLDACEVVRDSLSTSSAPLDTPRGLTIVLSGELSQFQPGMRLHARGKPLALVEGVHYTPPGDVRSSGQDPFRWVSYSSDDVAGRVNQQHLDKCSVRVWYTDDCPDAAFLRGAVATGADSVNARQRESLDRLVNVLRDQQPLGVSPRVALWNERAMFTWVGESGPTVAIGSMDDSGLHLPRKIVLRAFLPSGFTLVSLPSPFSPATLPDGRVLFVYSDGWGLWALGGEWSAGDRFITYKGSLPWRLVQAGASVRGSNPAVAVSRDGRVVVVYELNGALRCFSGALDAYNLLVGVDADLVADGQPVRGSRPSLAIDELDRVLIVFEVEAGGSIAYVAGKLDAQGMPHGVLEPLRTTMGGPMFEPAVAIDARGRAIVVCAVRDNDARLVYCVTTLDGAGAAGTWTANALTEGSARRGANPAVAFDNVGRLLVTYAGTDGGRLFYVHGVLDVNLRIAGQEQLVTAAMDPMR